MASETRQARSIERREAIRIVSTMLGGIALVSESALLNGCRSDRSTLGGAGDRGFSTDEIAFLDEVAETILPETTTPGAKAAGVGAFMALMVMDTYDEADQTIFRDGIRQLDEASRAMHGAGFMDATPQQRLTLLEQLDREQKAYMDAREAARRAGGAGAASPPTSTSPAVTADSPAHYFRMIKELTLLGYFTSEIGCTQAMRYVESPGRFDPCVPYTPGETSWAPHA